MKAISIWIIVALAFFLGCSKSESNIVRQNAIITSPIDTLHNIDTIHNPVITTVIDSLPNKVGDTWTYQVNDTPYFFFTQGVPTQYNMTVSITGTTLLPGNIPATTWLYSYPGGNETYYVFNKVDTLCFAIRSGSYYNIKKQYVFPLRLHNSWPYAPLSIHPVTVDSGATVTIGPNQYKNSLRIYGYPGLPDEMYMLDEWITDSVGIVKRHFSNHNFTTNPYQQSTGWLLLSYHL